MIVRGKHVMPRSVLASLLIEFNRHADGSWEPAIFVDRDALAELREKPSVGNWYRVGRSARISHDDRATHDIHLPGDGAPFDLDGTIAKLLIAEVLETE